MRFAATGDTHADEKSRMEEHDRVMSFIATDAAERGCELMLHGGDIYERRSTIAERESVRMWSQRVTRNMPLIICGGNHETPGEVSELSGYPNGMDGSHGEWCIGKEFPHGMSYGSGASVQCLPWPRRASLLKWCGAGTTREDVNQRGAELLRDILRGFSTRWKEGMPRILLAHAMVRGCKTSPDQPPLTGCDFELGIEDLALADADIVILSHVHMPQEWSYTAADGREVPVIYCGSPRRTAYSKGEQVEKSYVVAEFEGRRLVGWERVPTPATPLVLAEMDWVPDLGLTPTEEFVLPKDAEARLRYTVDSEHRMEAKAAADEIACLWANEHNATVKVEEQVRPKVRARAPEIAAATNLGDKLRAFWGATDPDMGEDKAARLLLHLDELGV